jgi:predicted nucleic acid-binding protein
MKKARTPDSYVLDTSALLTLWNDEAGAEAVEDLLRSGEHVHVSFMTYMEGRYRIWKNAGKEESDEFSKYLDLLPITRIDLSDAVFEKAVEIKATKSLCVCDSWIIATAMALNSIVVHKDPEFEQVRDAVRLRSLPYKPLKGRKNLGTP